MRNTRGDLFGCWGDPATGVVRRRDARTEVIHGRPRFASFAVSDGSKVSIAAIHPDFDVRRTPAVPDGIRWPAPQSADRTRGALTSMGFAGHGLTCLAITALLA